MSDVVSIHAGKDVLSKSAQSRHKHALRGRAPPPVEVLVGVAADFFKYDSFVRDPPAPATTCLMGAVDLVPVVWIALPVSGSWDVSYTVEPLVRTCVCMCAKLRPIVPLH